MPMLRPSRRPAPGRPQRRPRDKHTFAEACQAGIRRMRNPLANSIHLLVPALFGAVGFALGAGAGQWIALGFWLAMFVTGMLLLRRRSAGGDTTDPVDWDTAVVYEHQLRHQVPSTVSRILAEVGADAARLGFTAHPYRITCACGRSQDACICQARWSAMVSPRPGSDHVIVFVGDRLLDGDPQTLRYVLAHERAHLSPARLRLYKLHLLAVTDGAFLAGVLAPSLTAAAVAVAVLATTAMAAAWLIELSCDAVAARRHGAAAAVFWRDYAPQWARRARTALPWWQRALWLPASIMPAHPPRRLRAGLCRRIHRRTHQAQVPQAAGGDGDR